MYHKITGYLLVATGVCLILFSLIGLFKVFVNADPVLPVIQLSDVLVQSQFGPLKVPLQALAPALNLVLFTLFMLAVMSAGGNLAKIGTNLIKTERIHDALKQISLTEITAKENSKKL